MERIRGLGENMKKTIKLWTLALMISVFYLAAAGAGERDISKANDTAPPQTNNMDWIKAATQKYSPTSWDMLLRYDSYPEIIEAARKGGWMVSMKKPVATFEYLAQGNSKLEQIDFMAMNIRVITLALQRYHVFLQANQQNTLMDWTNAEVQIFFPDHQYYDISFPFKPLFPASELADALPKDQHTPLFESCIQISAIAQKYGIIGLFEEYHAHYLMARFYADMLDVYKEAENSDVIGFLEWVRNTQSTMASLSEFEFYMRVYLRRMRDKQPEDYAVLKAYQPFNRAHATLRLACEELIDRYQNLIASEMKRLNASGQANAVLVNHILWVTNKDGKTYNGTPVLAERDKLMERINGAELSGVVADATQP